MYYYVWTKQVCYNVELCLDVHYLLLRKLIMFLYKNLSGIQCSSNLWTLLNIVTPFLDSFTRRCTQWRHTWWDVRPTTWFVITSGEPKSTQNILKIPDFCHLALGPIWPNLAPPHTSLTRVNKVGDVPWTWLNEDATISVSSQVSMSTSDVIVDWRHMLVT